MNYLTAIMVGCALAALGTTVSRGSLHADSHVVVWESIYYVDVLPPNPDCTGDDIDHDGFADLCNSTHRNTDCIAKAEGSTCTKNPTDEKLEAGRAKDPDGDGCYCVW